MPPLESDKKEFVDKQTIARLEVKERKGLKLLTPKKLLTRLPVLLTQIKAEHNSCKLKNKIRQILHLLYQHNKITKKNTEN